MIEESFPPSVRVNRNQSSEEMMVRLVKMLRGDQTETDVDDADNQSDFLL